MDVRVVKRGEYDEEVVRWADAIISAGGTGTAAAGGSCFLVPGGWRGPERPEGLPAPTQPVSRLCPPGDGTMLLVASKVLSQDKPVVGVNTDPER